MGGPGLAERLTGRTAERAALDGLLAYRVCEPRSVLMAALVLASLPTLLVFIFAQRIIMRGIILPSYK